MKDWLANHVPESVVAFILAIVGWFAQRAIAKVDAHEARIASLERVTVTKDDFDELRESVVAQIANNQTRTEDRLERIWQHLAGGQ